MKTQVLQPDRARFRSTQEEGHGRQPIHFRDRQRLHAGSAGNSVTCLVGTCPRWFRESLWSISNTPSLVAGEGVRAVDKTPEGPLPGCRQAEAVTTRSTQKPPGVAGSECHSFGGMGNVNRGPREAHPAGLHLRRHCSVRKCPKPGTQQVQSPWGRKSTARSKERQGGRCGWRRGRGKEETREGTRRGRQGCVAAGLEDSAIPSEMEQWEVSAGRA